MLYDISIVSIYHVEFLAMLMDSHGIVTGNAVRPSPSRTAEQQPPLLLSPVQNGLEIATTSCGKAIFTYLYILHMKSE